MRFLHQERAALEKYLPGLDAALADIPLAQLEGRDGPGLAMFKQANGPALLVPTEHKGLGASAVDAMRVQRAIGTRSPSLAIGTTMHHFSIASLLETGEASTGFEWMLLQAVAEQRLLVASGFAEGRTGQAILSPGLNAELRDDHVVLNGAKKPCSLAHSMDLLTASVSLPGEDGPEMAIALIPKASEGLDVLPFWDTNILAGAESEEVRLTDVKVPLDLVVRTKVPAGHLDALQRSGFIWFELLMCASYLGMASALVERVLGDERTPAHHRAALINDVEAAMLTIEGIATKLDSSLTDETALAESLACRYHLQDVLGSVSRRCMEALGGMAFIANSDAAYLESATNGLSFHPPSRSRMAEALCNYWAGGPLTIA